MCGLCVIVAGFRCIHYMETYRKRPPESSQNLVQSTANLNSHII